MIKSPGVCLGFWLAGYGAMRAEQAALKALRVASLHACLSG
jgi:hypothetical protein